MHDDDIRERLAGNARAIAVEESLELPPTQELHILAPPRSDAFHVFVDRVAIRDWRQRRAQDFLPKRPSAKRMRCEQRMTIWQGPLTTV